MTENLPAANDQRSKEEDGGGRRDGGRFLAINNLHYYANDIAELRKLAEIDPLLAEKVIDQRDRESARAAASYNFGLISTVTLLSVVLVAFTVLLIFAGLFQTLVAVAAILATALLVRVIMTGEWSETSWFGKMVSALVKVLGGYVDDKGSDA